MHIGKMIVSFAEYRLFCRSLLQKRPIIFKSLPVVVSFFGYIQVSFNTLGVPQGKGARAKGEGHAAAALMVHVCFLLRDRVAGENCQESVFAVVVHSVAS